MGTKTYNNYQDLITFSRASAGYALRPVSYGSELVTNGDGGSITDWSAARPNSTVSVNNGRLRSTAIASGAHGIAQTLSNLTVGAIYFYSANVYADGGSGNMIFRVSALSTLDNQPVSDEQSTTRLVSGSFVATASTMYVGGIHVAAAGGDYIELDNVSIKEVTLDESGGRLTLFEHPDNVPRVEYALNDSKDRFENIDDEILRAVVGTEPQATEFDVLVNGQKIGDITNNGDVSAFDASQYSSWLAGTLTNQTYIDYIEDVLNPYIEANLDKYILPYPEGVDRLGLLVEEARTNLISTSDASGWVVSGSGTKTTNTEFTLGAFTGAIKASGGADWNRLRTGYVTVTSGTTYALTLFYKYGTSNNVLINFRDVSSAGESRIVGAWGSLTNSLGAAGTVTILEETSLPNDVKKVVIKYVPDFSGNFEFGVGPNSTTSGETVIPLAAQLEQASFGTSYIKTTGSSATRSADVPSIPTDDFGYNSAEGTVVCKFSFNYEDGGSGFPRPWEIGNTGNVSERINVYLAESTGALVSSVITDNAAQGNLTLKTGLSGSVDTTVAFAWARDSLGASDDGDTAVTDTDADILPTGTKRNVLSLKQTNATNANINGHIKYIKYYPRRLTNAQLEDLSS